MSTAAYLDPAKWHLATEIFPLMSEEELDRLAGDIRIYGLQKPIELHEGLIIDGRNRILACAKAEVEPRFVEAPLQGREPLNYVVSANLKRRHLYGEALDEVYALVRKVVTAGRGEVDFRSKPPLTNSTPSVGIDNFPTGEITPQPMRPMSVLSADEGVAWILGVSRKTVTKHRRRAEARAKLKTSKLPKPGTAKKLPRSDCLVIAALDAIQSACSVNFLFLLPATRKRVQEELPGYMGILHILLSMGQQQEEGPSVADQAEAEPAQRAVPPPPSTGETTVPDKEDEILPTTELTEPNAAAATSNVPSRVRAGGTPSSVSTSDATAFPKPEFYELYDLLKQMYPELSEPELYDLLKKEMGLTPPAEDGEPVAAGVRG